MITEYAIPIAGGYVTVEAEYVPGEPNSWQSPGYPGHWQLHEGSWETCQGAFLSFMTPAELDVHYFDITAELFKRRQMEGTG